MLARLQKLVVLVLILVSVTWATLAVRLGHAGWAVTGVVAVMLGYAMFLALEFAALRWVQQADADGLHAALRQLLAAWWGEVVTAPRVFFWRQPFRSNAEPDHLPARGNGRHGVVLVHGFVCNRGLWNPWMQALRGSDIPHVAVNLEPLFGSIDHYPSIIDDAVARVEAATGRPVVLVGHSMGGLAIRAWLRDFDSDARAHRVITIGSPHRGTWLARFGQTLNGKQMRIRSPWLMKLALDEPAERFDRFTCFYGHCDNIVFPTLTGTLPGALNVHVPGTAHVRMAFHPSVFNEVRRWLGDAGDSQPAPEEAAAR